MPRGVFPVEIVKPPREVERAIEALLRHKLRYDMAPKSADLLFAVVEGREPADIKTRVKCADTLLKAGGYVAPRPEALDRDAGKDLARMTRGQLHDFLQRAQDELASRAKPVIDASVDAPAGDEAFESLG